MFAPVIVPLVFLILGVVIRLKEFPVTKVDFDQRSAYECGFSSFQSARRPFSIYFFLVAIIFIVFDVELILLSFVPFVVWVNFYLWAGLFLFIGIVVGGLFHEWREGSFSWPTSSE